MLARNISIATLSPSSCEGRHVLDIACGDGYGSALLSQRAVHVTGVDISPTTVARAATLYARPNPTFLEVQATAIPLLDASVDLVVSFETIEHLQDHEGFLKEIRRVLVAGGLLLISLPDKSEYSERIEQRNPHHVRELTSTEFRSLLGGHFQNVSIAGQRYVAGSWLESEHAPEGSARGVFVADYDSMPFTEGPAEAFFLVACCSDATLPPLKLGMCLPPRATLDGWLEAIEILPSPQPLLSLVSQAQVEHSPPPAARQLLATHDLLQETRDALQKQKARAEKWKLSAETKARKLEQSQTARSGHPLRRLWEKWFPKR